MHQSSSYCINKHKLLAAQMLGITADNCTYQHIPLSAVILRLTRGGLLEQSPN